MAVSSTFPMWHEFFLHFASVDSLNADTDKVLLVSLNPAHDAATHFHDVIDFSDCCSLVQSYFPGHILFLHHFNSIEHCTLNPLWVKNIAIFRLLEQTKVTLVNTSISFQAMNIEVHSLIFFWMYPGLLSLTETAQPMQICNPPLQIN